MIIRDPEGQESKCGEETIVKEILEKNFPRLRIIGTKV